MAVETRLLMSGIGGMCEAAFQLMVVLVVLMVLHFCTN